MFDYYSRDSELSHIGGIEFQSTPPLESAGVFNVPEDDSSWNTEPPFRAWFELFVGQIIAFIMLAIYITCGALEW